MKTLTEIANEKGTDKGDILGYTPHYETHFDELSDQEINLVEIGVASGASLRTWDEYFTHPQTKILGVDIVVPTPFEHSHRVDVQIMDATKHSVPSDYDIIIDDGSHVSDDIIRSYNLWWPHLVDGGWYVIEDWKVQWWRDYGGHPITGSNAHKVVLTMVESLMRHDDKPSVSEVHVYDQLVFLRK